MPTRFLGRLRLLPLATVLASILSACSVAPPATQQLPAAAPQAAAVDTYQNPVFAGDFPDPFVLRTADAYYAYATNTSTVNVQLLRSTNLAEWEYVGDALPRLPEWTTWHRNLTWAPSVLAVGGRYVLYYTARDTAAGLQCISLAVSDTPEGPFVDTSSGPFVCQTELGGSIDPSPFVDEDGQAYLLWKNDGNCCGMFTALWIQPLKEDGQALTGEPVELIRQDQIWEYPLIEAPALIKHDGRYYLFYSANAYTGAEYAVGYAVSDDLLGPYDKPLNGPWMSYEGKALGPGGQEFFSDHDGNLWMAYHAWTAPDVGYPEGVRSLRLDRVYFEGGVPMTLAPSEEPQPLP